MSTHSFSFCHPDLIISLPVIYVNKNQKANGLLNSHVFNSGF